MVMRFSRRIVTRTTTSNKHDHGKTGEDRACHKVRREDRHVPAGHQRNRKVERHDAVHGQHQSRCQTRDDQVSLFEMSASARLRRASLY